MLKAIKIVRKINKHSEHKEDKEDKKHKNHKKHNEYNKHLNIAHFNENKHYDYIEVHFCIRFLISLCNNCKEFQDYLRVQHNRIRSTNILLSIITLTRICMNSLEHKLALKICINTFELIYVLINQKNRANIDFFIIVKINEQVNQIMNLGLFSKGKYYSINGEKLSIESSPVFNSNKLILELKHKALMVSNQMIDNKNLHEFMSSATKETLDKNLLIGYVQLNRLSNGVVHSMFFDKNNKICNDFNIKMLFECYSLRSRISDKDEIKEYNVIQIQDNEGTFSEFSREILKNTLSKYLKCRCCRSNIEKYKKDMNKDKFKKNALKFYEGLNSHIEILVPNNLSQSEIMDDPFLNYKMNDFDQTCIENNTIITKYFTIEPRFLFITQKQKTDFWTTLNSEDQKIFCKQLQNYGIKKNFELGIKEKVQNSWYTLPASVKRNNWLEWVLSFLILILNIIIFFGYTPNSTNNLEDIRILGSKLATYILIYGFGGATNLGYSYIVIIRIIINVKISMNEAESSEDDQDKGFLSIIKNACSWLYKWFKIFFVSRDLWCLMPCTIFAFLGMTYRFYFFIFCIIVYILFFENLMEIILAIWEPIERIVSALLFMLFVFYIYSALSFTYFRDDYSQNIPNSCDTMYNCLITIADQWHKNNALGGFLSSQVPAIEQDGTFKVSWGRFVFDMVFFIVVPTLLVNIVSGIIIDNFAEKRSKRDKLDEYQHSKCFVCGELENNIEDFNYHTKHKHNCWDYVYYIGFLLNSEYEDLVDYADIYVKKMIESNRSEWFPCYSKESNNDFSSKYVINQIYSQFDQIKEMNQNKFNKLHENFKTIEENLTKITNLLTKENKVSS